MRCNRFFCQNGLRKNFHEYIECYIYYIRQRSPIDFNGDPFWNLPNLLRSEKLLNVFTNLFTDTHYINKCFFIFFNFLFLIYRHNNRKNKLHNTEKCQIRLNMKKIFIFSSNELHVFGVDLV